MAPTYVTYDITSERLEAQIASLCGRVEALVPGCRAGVCIASSDHSKLERSVFPNLPSTFQEAIRDLPMGPPYIGCCTAAMDGNAIITIHDVEKESRFSDLFIATCLSHGIRSLRSRPVYGRADAPIGTFVMGYGEPSEEQRFDAPYLDFAADAVGAMLQRELDRSRKPLSPPRT
jgi:hypothetical protein